MSQTGLQLGRYRLLRLIGSGGMGEVYLAEDASIQRQVAIKVVRNELSPYPHSSITQEATRLFQREAKAIAMLDHAHILPLFDYGEQALNNSILTYMVMPYRKEGTLNSWLGDHSHTNQLSLSDISALIQQAASALQYAHNRQIIHQDIKPSNFLIRTNPDNPLRPDLLLADFGIVKFTDATSQSSNQMRGTPAYMAPEQWQGEPIPASDQYALAVMTYEILTGQLPFKGNMGQMMYAHVYNIPPRPSTLNTRLSSAIDSILLRGMAKEPVERFPSVMDFAQALEQAITQDSGMPGYEYQTIPESSTPTYPSMKSKGTNTYPEMPSPQPSFKELTNTPDRPQVQSPYYEQPPGESNGKRPKSKRISLLGGFLLFILLAAATGGGLWYFTSTHQSSTPTTNTQTNGDQNPYAPHSGTLVLNDPLQDNTKGYKWSEDTDSSGHCQFGGQAYHIQMTLPGIEYCYSRAAIYTNFAYEVQMNILQAGEGGLIVRSTQADQNFYYFAVKSDGSYRVVIYSSQQDTPVATLANGQNTQWIHTGLNTPNLLAVVAQGATLDFYVNHQHVSSVHDTTYSSGYIGTAVHCELNTTFAATEATFSHARLWKI